MASLTPWQGDNPALAIEQVDDALAFDEHSSEVLDRPADGISMIPGRVSIVNDAASDLVQAVARKQQVAHSPSLLTLSPKVQTNTFGAESASKGRYLGAATAWGMAA